MRIIVAYLAACVVAATIVFVYLQFKLDLLPESTSEVFSRCRGFQCFCLSRQADKTKLCSLRCHQRVSVDIVVPDRKHRTVANAFRRDDLWRAFSPALLFTFAGGLAGLVYWIVAERHRT